MEERFLIRSGDIAFVLASVFIVGIAAGTFNWDVRAIFLFLFVGGIVTIYYCGAKRFWLALVTALLLFVSAVGYHYFFAMTQRGNQTASLPQENKSNAFNFLPTVFNMVLPSRSAQFLSAIMLGSTAGMDFDLKAQMKASGTSYIVGMYGYKINLFTAAILGLGRRFFSRRIALATAACIVAIFIIMIGAPLSAVRAGIMMGLIFLARESGRLFRARNVLTFTVFIMLLFDPMLLGEPSFQLSFLSLLGVFMLGPPCKRFFHYSGDELLGWKAHAIMAFSINAVIMPVVMVQFGDFSVTSFISNFLIAIPFAAVVGLAIVMVALGFISPYLAVLVGALTNIFLSYQLCVIKLFSVFVIPLPPLFQSAYLIALYYFLLIAFAVHYGKKENKTMEQG